MAPSGEAGGPARALGLQLARQRARQSRAPLPGQWPRGRARAGGAGCRCARGPSMRRLPVSHLQLGRAHVAPARAAAHVAQMGGRSPGWLTPTHAGRPWCLRVSDQGVQSGLPCPSERCSVTEGTRKFENEGEKVGRILSHAELVRIGPGPGWSPTQEKGCFLLKRDGALEALLSLNWNLLPRPAF